MQDSNSKTASDVAEAEASLSVLRFASVRLQMLVPFKFELGLLHQFHRMFTELKFTVTATQSSWLKLLLQAKTTDQRGLGEPGAEVKGKLDCFIFSFSFL